MKNSYSKIVSMVLVLLASTSTVIHAQKKYNQTDPFLNANAYWAFYNHNGLDFSGGTPVHDSTSLGTIRGLGGQLVEGTSAVSDPNTGALLFYTDGRRIFNRQHELMPNGDSLFGNFNVNAVQGSCIVPVIGSTGKYYVFSMGTTSYQNENIGLYYSIVDMDLEGSLGDVVNGSKNIPLDTATLFNEAMIAIPGNNCNVWLLTHEAETKTFLAFEISASGISTAPVTSQGLYNTLDQGYHLSVSPDRTKIMMADTYPPYLYQIQNATTVGLGPGQYSELSLFDVSTGEVSSSIPIVPEFKDPAFFIPDSTYICGIYTSAFSPNGELLYLNQFSPFGDTYDLLAQVDISVHDSAAVNSSHQIIDTLTKGTAEAYSAAIRTYRDSIYILYQNSDLVGRVNQPNNAGQLCDLEPAAIQFPSPYSTASAVGVPNDVVYPFGKEEAVVLDTAACSNLTLRPSIGRAGMEYRWSDNSTDSVLQISMAGEYWVRYQYFEDNCIYDRTDTFKVGEGDMVPSPQINIDVDVLGTSFSYSTYQWMLNGSVIEGATDSTFTVTENGNYQVIVSNAFGCVDTSDVYLVENSGIYAVGNNPVDVQIYPNPVKDQVYIDYNEPFSYNLYQVDGKMILGNATGKSVDMRNLSPGFYLLKLFDTEGQVIFHAKLVKIEN